MCNSTSEFDASHRPEMTVPQKRGWPGQSPAMTTELHHSAQQCNAFSAT
jgi:hypothetical protein